MGILPNLASITLIFNQNSSWEFHIQNMKKENLAVSTYYFVSVGSDR
jgi:hypothetical protein